MVGEEGREAALRTLGERAVWRDVLSRLLWCLDIPKSSFGFHKNQLSPGLKNRPLVSGLYSVLSCGVGLKSGACISNLASRDTFEGNRRCILSQTSFFFSPRIEGGRRKELV